MATPQSHAFPKEFRIRSASEFRLVRFGGRKIQTPHFIIYSLNKGEGPTRLGLTVSRKVGGAVVRNRIKRLLREFFRLWQDVLPPHVDFSIIAKPDASGILPEQVHKELRFLFGPVYGGKPHV